MSVSRSRFQIFYNYNFNGIEIERVHRFTDLGIIFNSKFDFSDDVAFRISKAKAMLGFITRAASEFNDPNTLISLYNSLVRSNIEYCSQIWAPYQTGLKQDLEKVQNKCLRFLKYKEGCSKYEIIQKYDIIRTLETRRKIASIMFCFDILTGNVDSPGILSTMNIHCPTRQLRNNELLRVDVCSTNYAKFEPINVMCDNFNSIILISLI